MKPRLLFISNLFPDVSETYRGLDNATAYLTDLFTRLPSETNQTVHRLTPKAWSEARRQAKAKQILATI